MIHNTEKYQIKLTESSVYSNNNNNNDNTDLDFDPELYNTIVIFLNSISIGIIVTSLCDEELEPIERDRQIISIAMCIFIICEFEYMGLL
jgi:hypothetical protein